MMRLRYPLLVMGGLLLVLTYFSVPFATPDIDRHERTSDALRALILDEAALQRDVLKARAGLLGNYDPLVHSVENLRRAFDTLRLDGHVADSDARTKIDRHLEGMAAVLDEQEALVEAFKSHNALLQNSLMFFAHTIQQFKTAGNRPQDAVFAEVGTLASAMLRFATDPGVANSGDVTASLDRLDESPTEAAAVGVRELVAHGRLIAATLPEVDEHVSRLLAASTAERARALQDAYGEAHA